MSRIENAMLALTGRAATSAEIQKLMTIANTMQIKHDDPMVMLFMVLEHYNSLYSQAPKRIESAVFESTKGATKNAQAAINKAVAEMVPGVQKAVENAARQGVKTMQLSASMITIFAGFVILGIIFCLGILYGIGVNSNSADTAPSRAAGYLFYGSMGGVTVIGLLVIATLLDGNKKFQIYQQAALAASIILILLLTGKIVFL